MANLQNSTEGIQAQATSASTSSFVTALVFNLAVFGAELLAFSLLRKYFKTIYEPRTFLTPEGKRVKPLSQTIWDWPRDVFLADSDLIRQQNGLDAYMFVRFLRMMVKILLPIWFFSWAVLMPVTSVRTSVPGNDGLNIFTFGNIAPKDSARYSAHLILAWLFTFWILYVVRIELRRYITLRQRHLIDPNHASTAQANTVLVTGVPQKYLSEQALTKLFQHCPGGVRKVWLNRDLKDLPGVYDRRLSACNKLESAENALLKTALKIHKKNPGIVEKQSPDVESGSIGEADRIVPKNKRPSHRLPAGSMPFSLPLIGQKVDTIEWCKKQILECNQILAAERKILYSEIRASKKKKERLHLPAKLQALPGQIQSHLPHSRSRGFEEDPEAVNHNGIDDASLEEHNDELGPPEEEASAKYPPLNSAFILFKSQIGAHVAAQILTHDQPFRMVDKYIELSPDEVVWGNLGLNPYEKLIRKLISFGLTSGLIIAWAIPVAFVGIISNIHSLCTTYSWLAWLCKIPSVIVGIIQGILPSVLLAVLFILLPIVLRLLARFEGIPTRTGIELSLMTRFFAFQVVHGFLVVSLSSGIIAALPDLVKNASSIPATLAQRLPNASTFFLTYIILQGLTGTAGGFLTIVPLVIYYVKLIILGSTPRSIYNIKYTLRDVAWGTLFPSITLLVVITFAYAIISPIINGLACFTFFLFYMLYKYLFLWQLGFSESGDSGGLFFPKAIQHTFVGLYIQQIVLAALFFLAQDENKKASAIPEGILMIVLILITALANSVLNNNYSGQLLTSLPLTLADRAHAAAESHERRLIDERNDAAHHDEHEETPLAGNQAPGPSSSPDAEEDPKPLPVPPRPLGPTDFEHPSVRTPQRPIWIPADPLGVGHSEAGSLRADGIDASTVHAMMNEKGKVEVDGRPPEDEN
ncbi:hypothetical protein M422DRAFT_211854 [Sphaerobolus stellatus SS14]|uniref:DUF221-domain-containing protein n=1 Tax=Sphaerobolus stellatus (strain SS14) TaxID=990650 RepID=A0A0C9V5V4_SPHS4|nr:hypothetical protein M422DRAFT_211854 [Sphaerobolus stellatus SS14]